MNSCDKFFDSANKWGYVFVVIFTVLMVISGMIVLSMGIYAPKKEDDPYTMGTVTKSELVNNLDNHVVYHLSVDYNVENNKYTIVTESPVDVSVGSKIRVDYKHQNPQKEKANHSLVMIISGILMILLAAVYYFVVTRTPFLQQIAGLKHTARLL